MAQRGLLFYLFKYQKIEAAHSFTSQKQETGKSTFSSIFKYFGHNSSTLLGQKSCSLLSDKTKLLARHKMVQLFRIDLVCFCVPKRGALKEGGGLDTFTATFKIRALNNF